MPASWRRLESTLESPSLSVKELDSFWKPAEVNPLEVNPVELDSVEVNVVESTTASTGRAELGWPRVQAAGRLETFANVAEAISPGLKMLKRL